MSTSAVRAFSLRVAMAIGRTALHLTLICRGRDTNRITLCVASHLTTLSHAGEQTASQAGYAMCVFHRNHVGPSKAEYAMGVASDLVWAITTASQAECANTPCASLQIVRRFAHHSFYPASAPCPNAGEVRWRARRGSDGARVTEQAVLAGAHSQHRWPSHHCSKKDETYSHHSPSIVHDAQSDEIRGTQTKESC